MQGMNLPPAAYWVQTADIDGGLYRGQPEPELSPEQRCDIVSHLAPYRSKQRPRDLTRTFNAENRPGIPYYDPSQSCRAGFAGKCGPHRRFPGKR